MHVMQSAAQIWIELKYAPGTWCTVFFFESEIKKNNRGAKTWTLLHYIIIKVIHNMLLLLIIVANISIYVLRQKNRKKNNF